MQGISYGNGGSISASASCRFRSGGPFSAGDRLRRDRPSYMQGSPKAGALQLVYIYKEGLSRTVVRELLPRATAHGHQTFPDYGRHTRSRSKGGDVREEAPAEECAAKNLQTTVRQLGFTEKIYGFPRTLLCCQYKRRTPTVVRELLPRTSTKRAQTFPAVARCTLHQYKVVDVLK